jgi:hypothetical protein
MIQATCSPWEERPWTKSMTVWNNIYARQISQGKHILVGFIPMAWYIYPTYKIFQLKW